MADDFAERKLGELTVRIDRSLCIASASCMVVAPDLFEFGEDNICTYAEEADGVERDTVIEACEACPVDALIVIDSAGKQLVP